MFLIEVERVESLLHLPLLEHRARVDSHRMLNTTPHQDTKLATDPVKANDRWPRRTASASSDDVSDDDAVESQSVSSNDDIMAPTEHDGKGRWTKAEHERFMRAVSMYPCGPWKHIGAVVKTRSIRQIQTHAQKLREKAARHDRGLKIKIKDPIAVTLPPYFLARDRSSNSRVLGPPAKAVTPSPSTHNAPDLLPLDDCLDFFLQVMDEEEKVVVV
ncbi:hypothetical protein H310_03123 [Aphanomyces invadans]|uniref:Uncharacterized protein n=1 Tax=Aphanomyces invadans TaxID=157072 RepID=A0A024UMF9_9STRA|nr:hypothetical protein H310_03123 [Aphanomyces invadans]ETW07037.1 hypothetical protein H310_03123 [Aphanomyces invadans]|eukprot:XP_008865112.1 hypothetical protein H310_03123 [Aphanomyces invadans]